ncbi:MAG: Gfo/Idh/MocA family oxidoreductase [Bryobacterales bacterium]|nr:Gfo/Idh/MocA family oxidoreductase [Bryobacterales bacterium]
MERRTFVAASAALAASGVARGDNHGDKIRLGVIGCGRRGRSNLRSVLKLTDDIQVVALSEVFKPNLEETLKMVPDAKIYPDFRDLIADKDIDAVLIATPDHWHAYMSVEACQAGKDVYVEKPISVTVHEGQMMVKAARKYDRIVQVGTQQRSGKHFAEAKDIVQSGRLGTISFVRTWNYSNLFPRGIGVPPDTDPPADLDWDMWLGPAPERPFNKNRFGVNPYQFAHFRWFWDYAGGMMTDWGIHLLDIVLWATAEPGPRSICTYGGKYALTDNRETPDTIQATYEFPTFVCTYENRVANAFSGGQPGYGILFHGTEGTLYVNRGFWEITPEARRYREPEPRVERRMEAARGESANNSTDDHWRDFIAAVRNRNRPICDIEIGHKSTAMALLGNVSLRSRQRVDWDPVNETTENKEAQTYLRNDYREPWKLEL